MTNTPYLQLTWFDDQTGARGYLVIDTLSRGVASGGLRMRPGCSLGEVVALARAMTLKEALVYEPGQNYLPFGGAKAGIDFDPRHPAAREVLRRFVIAIRPLLDVRWAVGEDLGTTQEAIDEAVAAAELRSCVHAALRHVPDGGDAGLHRIAQAFDVEVDGLGLGDFVGGYGVAQAALAALAEHDEDPTTKTAVVQGFGSMGGAAARYLSRAGLRIAAIADQLGAVVDPSGLNVEALLANRSRDGVMCRESLAPGCRLLDREEWLSVPVDVLVTAAGSDAVNAGNHARVRGRYLVEAANISVTADAEAALLARGVVVLPDFLANLAANAWWWWTLFGDIGWTADDAFTKIEKTMWRLVSKVLTDARRTGRSPREVATGIAEHHRATLRDTLIDR